MTVARTRLAKTEKPYFWAVTKKRPAQNVPLLTEPRTVTPSTAERGAACGRGASRGPGKPEKGGSVVMGGVQA